MTWPRFVFAAIAILLMLPALAAGETASGAQAAYVLRSSVMGAAGAHGTSTGFAMDATLGQSTPVGTGISTNFGLNAGFWGLPPIVTSAPEEAQPAVFRSTLFRNTPNPFNPITTIRYEIGEPARVEIAIYSVDGRLVRMLVDEAKSPGSHQIVWDGRDADGNGAGSGVYLYRLRAGTYNSVKKMVLIK